MQTSGVEATMALVLKSSKNNRPSKKFATAVYNFARHKRTVWSLAKYISSFHFHNADKWKMKARKVKFDGDILLSQQRMTEILLCILQLQTQ
jgi:hypothetical protein